MAKKRVVRMARRKMAAPGGFGPVSTINTAPVSVGNSVRGSAPRVTQTTDGARVVGRDFAFALSGTSAAVTNWEIIGSMPITPAVLPSSILRNYCQMFNKFKVNSVTFHYITSSPTSQAGDVMFYYEKDRLAPSPDYSNSSFLPFVLSDPHTVIGPQWTNHSIRLTPTKDWKTTLFANQSDINEDAEGTIYFFSKTNSANSPGYLLMDYDIQFKELSVNPRAGTLPVARGQSTFVSLTPTTSTPTVGSAAQFAWNAGKTIANVTSTIPNGASQGDIYKCVIQWTASTLNNTFTGSVLPISDNILRYPSDNNITLDDGFTCYASYLGSNIRLFATLEAAVVNASGALEWATTSTGFYVALCADIMLVRQTESGTQSSY
ncbi:hypothetical protein 3 [Beihai sobemo-like virus 25]|uniref:hypothetical protein 3 n=1 Tax=Beihai sobemo-like virus 25 TaxID=1922697 RepID=UPI00090B3E3B|nr:hypothetical protein 3 [Beihai sobemo-like virus 25]APG75688.1 hypothetical protein 3 [Beihai sobemo-like virus 25]